MTEKMPKPDDVVFGYRIVRVIGKGGMGAVFEGVDDKPASAPPSRCCTRSCRKTPKTCARFQRGQRPSRRSTT